MTLVNKLEDVLRAFELEKTGDYEFRAHNVAGSKGVIYGGQLMAQAISVAALLQPDKNVKTIHIVFTRGGDPAIDLEVDAEEILNGRAFGSVTVTFRQKGKVSARAQVLTSATEPDLIRHAAAAPEVAGPAGAKAGMYDTAAWETRIVDGVDLRQVDQELEAQLRVWSRWPEAPDDILVSQQLLAWSTDQWLIGTSMLPHRGYAQSLAHREFSTGVITHTLTFHEPFYSGDWLLLDQEVPYAGLGRVYGRAQVFTEDGRLVAAYVQDAMVRAFPELTSPGKRPGLL